MADRSPAPPGPARGPSDPVGAFLYHLIARPIGWLTRLHPLRFLLARIAPRVVTGITVVVPIAITIAVVQALFGIFSRGTSPLARILFGEDLRAAVVVGPLLALLLLYLVGALASNIAFRKFFAVSDWFFQKIPVARNIFAAVKELFTRLYEAVNRPERAAFQRAVWLDYPRGGMKSLGFVATSFVDAGGRRFLSVFVPTVPNLTIGMVEFVPEDEVEPAGFTPEEGLRLLLSIGTVSPAMRDSKPPSPAAEGPSLHG